MKRQFWLSYLLFTGGGLMFFISLHLSVLIRIKFSESLLYGGLTVFGLGLIPMWLVAVFDLAMGEKTERTNWIEKWTSGLPRPSLAKKLFIIFWCYFCGSFGLFLLIPQSWGFWANYLRAAGMPGVFIGFYGAGFICAWANWRRARGIDPSTSSG